MCYHFISNSLLKAEPDLQEFHSVVTEERALEAVAPSAVAPAPSPTAALTTPEFLGISPPRPEGVIHDSLEQPLLTEGRIGKTPLCGYVCFRKWAPAIIGTLHLLSAVATAMLGKLDIHLNFFQEQCI